MQTATPTAISPRSRDEQAKLADYRRLMIEAYKSERERARAGDTAGTQDEYDFRLSPHAYPGLRSFNPREGGVFFGREPNILDIQRRLAARGVVVVLGGSGSGKSSVIRAGLMPRLTSTLSIEGRSGNWYAAEFRPRLRPMEELVAALAGLVASKFPDQGPAVPEPYASGATAPSAQAKPDGEAVLARLRRQFHLGGTQDVSTEQSKRKQRADALARALLDFVDTELDRRDDLAARRLRSGRASLLLLIDQFEEIFRPEVPARRAGSRQDLLDMIIAVDARLRAERDQASEQKSGLFLAITMRSEELHRCAEHPSLDVGKDRVQQRSLADIVNSCGYLLDLLDPLQDRSQLTEAIVSPARRVFRDWGLLRSDDGDKQAPFAPGVVDWLLHGAARMSDQLEHRADQLPLLQHGLQTMWHNAIQEWSDITGDATPLVIERRHLLGGARGDIEPPAADFVACLDRRADRAFERARERFVAAAKGAPAAVRAAASDAAGSPDPGPDDGLTDAAHWRALSLELEARLARIKSGATGDGDLTVPDADARDQQGSEAVIRAAFRALARRDDRGNWARRFAGPERIMEFVHADPEATFVRTEGANLVVHVVEPAFIGAALQEFIASGYLSGSRDRPFDISHEALIRNWRRFKLWLIEPDDAAQALMLAVNLLDVDNPGDVISSGLARSLAPVVGRTPTLPEGWAREQIVPLVARRDVRLRWSKTESDYDGDLDALASVVVRKISTAWKRAEQQRLGADLDSYWRERFELQRRVTRLSILVALGAVALSIAIGVAGAAAAIWRALGGG
jgi:hypothetical protein